MHAKKTKVANHNSEGSGYIKPCKPAPQSLTYMQCTLWAIRKKGYEVSNRGACNIGDLMVGIGFWST